MSFDTICSGCGAPSGPAVGVCPFCKNVMTEIKSTKPEYQGNLDLLNEFYREGKLDRALALGSEMIKSDSSLNKDLGFISVFVKILFEAQAPTSRIRSFLAEAHLAHPRSADLMDYLEILDAHQILKKGLNDAGEVMLKNLVRRSPNNTQAHFLLGAHLFWEEGRPVDAIPHLETCVRLHPCFLRAWACLGAIYKSLGNEALSQNAFRMCAGLETNSKMKDYFKQQSS